jgi:DNA-binding PadR family transcriptional regulator
MDEQIPVRTVLRVISGRGAASLELVARELEPHAAASNVARAFQAARAKRLIEVDPSGTAVRDPVYRLTPSGTEALERRRARRTADRLASARRGTRRLEPVALQRVLNVLADFDEFGGASRDLVAWELDVEESAVAAAWARAVDDGLLEESVVHDALSEKMWRLTERGKRAHEDSHDLSG